MEKPVSMRALNLLLLEYGEWAKKIWRNALTGDELWGKLLLYLCINSGKLVGLSNIRYGLPKKDLSEKYGHIGYGVRPPERKKAMQLHCLKSYLLKLKRQTIEACISLLAHLKRQFALSGDGKWRVIMIDIKSWMERFTELLKETFGERIYFVGLQGSYGRGEATESSDIDVVVILDELTVDDIKSYGDMIDTLPHRCFFRGLMFQLLRFHQLIPSLLPKRCKEKSGAILSHMMTVPIAIV